MRLQISKSTNAASLYIVKSTYDRNGKRSNKVVEKLGTFEELSKIYDDPIAWGKEYAEKLTLAEEEKKKQINVQYNPSERMKFGVKKLYHGGYLFLEALYYQYGLNKICKDIEKKYKFDYDLDSILSRLIYGRILFPGSKKSTVEDSDLLLEKSNFQLHQVYRSLGVLAKEMDYIQSQLYINSKKVSKRNDNILYYDCTNFFFEIEEESGIKQYGISKEHRPNPIVEMGLFMDGDGIPLAFCIHPGNTNEQQTLKPLEKQIITDFKKSKFVVCTDAGLSSTVNRKFNAIQERAFITVQSIKTMNKFQKEWALDVSGWHIYGSEKEFSLEEVIKDRERYEDSVFYKETYFNDSGFDQRYIVTFSIKYMDYLKNIREKQIQRAQKIVDLNSKKSPSQNNPERFVEQLYFDDNGVISEHKKLTLNQDKINEDAKYDGFYCVATNLEDPAEEIIKVNSKRWEIEESFRIMKSEFKSRPVFLSRDDRIKAHFLICFLSLFIYRRLEKQLNSNYTTSEIIKTLRTLQFYEIPKEGYAPAYSRTDITDALHHAFNFYTDYEFNSLSYFRKIFKQIKNSQALCTIQ